MYKGLKISIFVALFMLFIPAHYTFAYSYESINFQYENQQAGILTSLLNLLSPISNAQTPDITTGLVGHWKFDDTGIVASDSSGNGNDGIFIGGPMWTTGKIGGALSFDGVDDYVDITNITNPKSISLWVKSALINHDTVFDWGTNQFGIRFLPTGAFRRFINGGNSGDTITGLITADVWQHFVWVSEGTDMVAYVNGVEVDRRTGSINDGTNGFKIGERGSGGYQLDGLIDEVRIYNRALTQADITELYNYTGGPPPETCTSFTYSEWLPTTCPSNETQTRTVLTSLPEGCSGGTQDTTQSCTYTPPPPDTDPPTIPTNLTATPISSSQINLSWNASTDNVGVTGYNVYRDGSLLTTDYLLTTYSDTGLTASTTYSYTVSAYDVVPNTSAQSTSVSATTQELPISDHSYFDSLSARPESILSKAYRTQAEIDADDHGGPGNVVYDVVQDAMKFTVTAYVVPDKDAAIDGKDQVRPNFTATNSGNLLFYWESRWESGFVDVGIYGLNTHKAFQLATFDTAVSKGGKVTIEPRLRFSEVDAPYVARVDVRAYGNEGVDRSGPGGSIAPQSGEFNILSDVWVRMWVFLDMDSNKIWYWVGDENRANVTILNNVDLNYSLAYPSKLFDEFFFEHNSSQKKQVGFPELNIWNRNLVVLKDVTDASAIVAQGDSENTQSILTADIAPVGNLDGTVNALDWSLMNAAWGTADPTADINNDGIVNTIDFSIMNSEWGQSN